MNRSIDVGTSWTASVLRGLNGYSVGPLGRRPVRPVELYEFENCPFCRIVRDALSELDLEAVIRPCPKRGERFRPEVVRLGGKAQFPHLVDSNTGTSMYESAAIVSYLHQQYGTGRPSPWQRLPLVNRFSSLLASAARRPAGTHRALPSLPPAQPLELWSFEASPYCRLAREALCQLELPYLLHNVAKRSPSRQAFVTRSGRMMVPYLADPNTGRELFESAAIVKYLHDTYGAAKSDSG